jgi:4-hydroxybenzoyl-CoA thioesterase
VTNDLQDSVPFQIPIRVYIEDTDAGGIVYYVNYLKFMERCRTEFLRALGYHKAAISDDGQLLVVHSVQVDYRRPARLDDVLSVTASISKLARTSMEFKQQVLRNSELLCSASLRIACVDASAMKPCALPKSLHQLLTQQIESQLQG